MIYCHTVLYTTLSLLVHSIAFIVGVLPILNLTCIYRSKNNLNTYSFWPGRGNLCVYNQV